MRAAPQRRVACRCPAAVPSHACTVPRVTVRVQTCGQVDRATTICFPTQLACPITAVSVVSPATYAAGGWDGAVAIDVSNVLAFTRGGTTGAALPVVQLASNIGV